MLLIKWEILLFVFSDMNLINLDKNVIRNTNVLNRLFEI